MSKFRKNDKKGMPAISTASLPDIIFMLLFFFMVSTVMRTDEILVHFEPPQASEVQKLEDKELVNYIAIGKPTDESLGSQPRIQLNDQFAKDVIQVREYIIGKRNETDEAKRQKLITSLKVDKEVKMGIVTDVKQELRQVGAFKINYSAVQGNRNK